MVHPLVLLGGLLLLAAAVGALIYFGERMIDRASARAAMDASPLLNFFGHDKDTR